MSFADLDIYEFSQDTFSVKQAQKAGSVAIYFGITEFSFIVKVKSSQLYLGRVAPSAIGWYQKGPCVNYDYTIKI